MKRIVPVLLAVALLLAPGCARSGEQGAVPMGPEAASDAGGPEANPGGELSVDRGLFDVTLTIPASFLGEGFSGELTEENRADGLKSVRVNGDGSVTYTMGKKDYDKLMLEYRQETMATLEALPGVFDFIVEVRPNSRLTEATVLVDRSLYESGFDRMAAWGIYLHVAFYQIFCGVAEEDVRAVVYLIDADTGEEISTVLFPDDFR